MYSNELQWPVKLNLELNNQSVNPMVPKPKSISKSVVFKATPNSSNNIVKPVVKNEPVLHYRTSDSSLFVPSDSHQLCTMLYYTAVLL